MFINFFKNIITILLASVFVLSLTACNKKNLDKNRPLGAKEKRERNIKEGRGVSIGGLMGRGGSTNYEFSTSNPMWRASLETLDFLPLLTVDYSGGVIISDWYSDINSSGDEAIKISLRFLGNDIRSENLKVIVHKKNCKNNSNCKVTILSNTKIKEELHQTILRKAALLEKQSKKKK